MKIVRFAIVRLFDLFDYDFFLKSADNVTILYGPNGYGKTAILRLIGAITSARLQALRTIPFSSVTLGFDNGTQLTVMKSRVNNSKKEFKCQFILAEGSTPVDMEECVLDETGGGGLAAIRQNYPYLHQIDSDIWEDTTDGELISTAELYRRFNIDPEDEGNAEVINWLKKQMISVNVRFIDTQRLLRRSPRPPRGRPIRLQHSPDFTSVSNYSHQLARQIQSVLGEYAERSQRLDQSFPYRLLARFQNESQTVITDEDLSERLLELDRKRLRLREAGLLEQEEQMVQLPRAVEGGVKRLLGLYLTDVSEKLAAFDAILDRIEILREIIDGHFTYKRMVISREYGFQFETSTGRRLAASSLSSGEQHMLILIYELLFVEQKESLVLIDEPEISLHISWQLSFLSDLERIAKLNNNNILIATHSPQIIGDRVDLTVELQEPVRPEARAER
jgi:predicted ATP-binding protein involved in virulence